MDEWIKVIEYVSDIRCENRNNLTKIDLLNKENTAWKKLMEAYELEAEKENNNGRK